MNEALRDGRPGKQIQFDTTNNKTPYVRPIGSVIPQQKTFKHQIKDADGNYKEVGEGLVNQFHTAVEKSMYIRDEHMDPNLIRRIGKTSPSAASSTEVPIDK